MSDKTTCTSAGTGTPVTTQTICNRPFIAHEHGIGDPLDPFAKDKIETRVFGAKAEEVGVVVVE